MCRPALTLTLVLISGATPDDDGLNTHIHTPLIKEKDGE
jgi:hypothetical protein